MGGWGPGGGGGVVRAGVVWFGGKQKEFKGEWVTTLRRKTGAGY